jgi:hypothetical protein
MAPEIVSPLAGLWSTAQGSPALPPPQHTRERRVLGTPLPRWAKLFRPSGTPVNARPLPHNAKRAPGRPKMPG